MYRALENILVVFLHSYGIIWTHNQSYHILEDCSGNIMHGYSIIDLALLFVITWTVVKEVDNLALKFAAWITSVIVFGVQMYIMGHVVYLMIHLNFPYNWFYTSFMFIKVEASSYLVIIPVVSTSVVTFQWCWNTHTWYVEAQKWQKKYGIVQQTYNSDLHPSECCICMIGFTNVVASYACCKKHIYHKHCLQRWNKVQQGKPICPLCGV